MDSSTTIPGCTDPPVGMDELHGKHEKRRILAKAFPVLVSERVCFAKRPCDCPDEDLKGNAERRSAESRKKSPPDGRYFTFLCTIAFEEEY